MTLPADVHFVAALEQLQPTQAVRLATEARRAGFAGTMVFDRFQPWLPSQGQAPSVWTVAGAMASGDSGLITVSAVPGYRMHPAATAQASATLASLAEDGHRLLLSAGDAIDEHIAGGYWPEAPDRASRLFEAADMIRRLFSASAKGNDTRHAGEHYRLETSRLWTLPETAPAIHIWAGGPVTARRAGRSGLGIVVQAAARDRLAAILHAFDEGRRESGSSAKAVAHVQLSWAPTDDDAMHQALEHWPMAGLRFPRGDIRSPFDVAQLAHSVTTDDIRTRIPVHSDASAHARHIRSFLDMGFASVQVHNVGRNHEEWLEAFEDKIAPELQARS